MTTGGTTDGENARMADPSVRLELARGSTDERIATAVALGNKAARTLGLLPISVYRDAADQQELLLAVTARQEVVGYALFDLTIRQVRLVHLCVDNDRRKQGIARALVD